MTLTIKFSEMPSGGDLAQGDQTPGLLSGANVLFNNPWTFLAPGSTAGRPPPSSLINYRLRLNTDTQTYEYYDAFIAMWVELSGSGTGTINPGVTNDLAFYPANGTTLSPIAAAANSVLVTSAGSVPSLSTTLPSGLSIPGATITSSTAALTAGSVIAAPVAGSDLVNKTYADGLYTASVHSITGTTNQVIASSPTEDVILSLPQDIATGSSPIFSTITLSSTMVHGVLIGEAGSAIHSITPSTTSGIPLISQGVSSDPIFGTAVVAGGGTGNTSFTAYSVICGGTTSTGALQNVSGVGTANQVLTSNGAGALPTWQSASATGAITQINGDSGSVTPSAGVVIINGGSIGLTTSGSGNTLSLTGTLAILHGGTGVTSVTTAPTATSFAGWDANKNLSANNHIEGFTTTATAGGTTVLTVASTEIQEFTGTLTQTVTLPVTSTLVAGQAYFIINNSSGVVTVQSSGANTVQAMAANTSLFVTCVLNSGTTAASWNGTYVVDSGGGVSPGTANQLAYYAVTGNNVSGLATANSSVLVTDSGGVPSLSSTLPNINIGTPTAGVATNLTGTGGLRSFQIFTSGTAATYTKPANVTSILVEVVGGGGGSGGVTGGAGGAVSASGGGAGGGYARLFVKNASSTYTYTVGAGGTAGTSGNNTGGTGGTTSFSASSLQATGGIGGTGDTSHAAAVNAATSSGSSGGIGSNGDINIRGSSATGSAVLTGSVLGSNGGISYLGGGIAPLNAGLNYGGGGAGNIATTTSAAGFAGAPGIIIVWEFS